MCSRYHQWNNATVLLQKQAQITQIFIIYLLVYHTSPVSLSPTQLTQQAKRHTFQEGAYLLINMSVNFKSQNIPFFVVTVPFLIHICTENSFVPLLLLSRILKFLSFSYIFHVLCLHTFLEKQWKQKFHRRHQRKTLHKTNIFLYRKRAHIM